MPVPLTIFRSNSKFQLLIKSVIYFGFQLNFAQTQTSMLGSSGSDAWYRFDSGWMGVKFRFIDSDQTIVSGTGTWWLYLACAIARFPQNFTPARKIYTNLRTKGRKILTKPPLFWGPCAIAIKLKPTLFPAHITSRPRCPLWIHQYGVTRVQTNYGPIIGLRNRKFNPFAKQRRLPKCRCKLLRDWSLAEVLM